MQHQYKTCPRCQTRTGLTAERCDTCWHQFKTDFSAPPSHTQAMNAPTGTLSPPVFVAPNDPRISNPVPSQAYKEYVRQYVSMLWILTLGILGIMTGPIGIGMIIYAIIQKQALRRRVAEYEGDPELLRQEAHVEFGRQVKPLLIALACFIAMVVLLLIIGNILFNNRQKEDTRDEYNGGYKTSVRSYDAPPHSYPAQATRYYPESYNMPPPPMGNEYKETHDHLPPGGFFMPRPSYTNTSPPLIPTQEQQKEAEDFNKLTDLQRQAQAADYLVNRVNDRYYHAPVRTAPVPQGRNRDTLSTIYYHDAGTGVTSAVGVSGEHYPSR